MKISNIGKAKFERIAWFKVTWIIWPLHWVKKIGKNQKDRLWVHETLIHTYMCNIALKLPNKFACRSRSLLVATSKFSLLTIQQHCAIIKHLFLDLQGDRSGLRKSKRISSTLITAYTSVHLPKPVSTDLMSQI